MFQCNSKLTDKLNDAEVQLKQQPASTHTMQAILEAKVRSIVLTLRDLIHLVAFPSYFTRETTFMTFYLPSCTPNPF